MGPGAHDRRRDRQDVGMRYLRQYVERATTSAIVTYGPTRQLGPAEPVQPLAGTCPNMGN